MAQPVEGNYGVILRIDSLENIIICVTGGAGGQVLINGWLGFASFGDKIQVIADRLNSLSMWAFPFKGAY